MGERESDNGAQSSPTGETSAAAREEKCREEYLFSGLQHNAKFQINEQLCVNLFEHFVDWTNVHCLNDSHKDPFPSRDWRAGRPRQGQKFVSSANDAQLIIHIPFSRKVKLMGIRVGVEPEMVRHGPSTIHVYKDLPTLDFTDVSLLTPLHTLHLTPDDLCPHHGTATNSGPADNAASASGICSDITLLATPGPIASARALASTAVPLPVRLFSTTSSLWLFIEDNQGGEQVTIISTMQAWGVPLPGMDLKHIQR
ncbi:hypothetical protein BESB_006000 [Besnoitia besnoiti]|uniref:PITH domain-containing protein n=1 Tax=Besnoitia besnoiti TaxID=94643 RepID=A0A2A9MK12_BESBE|nr:hypothetical protein BESB_006000 [Besnoitia besnoiti]PFH38259.1 hypothetical protein BESB_006000 [Besnoitia besnoiti]